MEEKQQQQKSARLDHKFTVELGDGWGRNFTIRSLGYGGSNKLRGMFNKPLMHSRPGGSPAIEGKMSEIPDIPGVHIDVDCRKKTVTLRDPLINDQPRVDAINRVLRKANLAEDHSTPTPVTHQLDDDKLKTFLFELLRMGDAVHLREGTIPTVAEIDAAPGFELWDPGNQSQSTPKYKKDFDAYRATLERAGRL